MSLVEIWLRDGLTLLALVDPFILIPLFLRISEGHAAAVRNRFALRVAVVVVVALAVATVAGPALFAYLGLSIAALQITGGFVLATMGMAMLLGRELSAKQSPTEERAVEQDVVDAETTAMVPLAVPLLAGPASFSFVMTRGPESLGTTMAAIAAVGATVWLTFRAAPVLAGYLTVSRVKLIERLAGLLVTVMAFEVLGRGLKTMFPALDG